MHIINTPRILRLVEIWAARACACAFALADRRRSEPKAGTERCFSRCFFLCTMPSKCERIAARQHRHAHCACLCNTTVILPTLNITGQHGAVRSRGQRACDRMVLISFHGGRWPRDGWGLNPAVPGKPPLSKRSFGFLALGALILLFVLRVRRGRFEAKISHLQRRMTINSKGQVMQEGCRWAKTLYHAGKEGNRSGYK